MGTLLIDNYDSYTYNLYHQIATVNGVSPQVVTNDGITLVEVQRLISSGYIRNIVISPGPGSPNVTQDVGIVLDLFQELKDVPILGVCLGHQALAHVHGATVMSAPEPCHGRLSEIQHTGHPLFSGIPSGQGNGFKVVRYHSLIVDERTLPSVLEPICWTAGANVAIALRDEQDRGGENNEKILMGVARKDAPHYGVQFHPESVATQFGNKLISNFIRLSHEYYKDKNEYTHKLPSSLVTLESYCGYTSPAPQRDTCNGKLALALRYFLQQSTSGELPCCEKLMETLNWSNQRHSFWLDSELSDRARFSFMGGPGGRLWRKFLYKLPQIGNERDDNEHDSCSATSGKKGCSEGMLTEIDKEGQVKQRACHFSAWLNAYTQKFRVEKYSGQNELPFDFVGGLVGYLGYELKAESCGTRAHDSRYADAALFFVDRMVVVDHKMRAIYALALELEDAQDVEDCAQAWLSDTESKIQELMQSTGSPTSETANTRKQMQACLEHESAPHPVSNGIKCLENSLVEPSITCSTDFQLARTKSEYIEDITACMEELYAGNSYEICLTNRIKCQIPSEHAWQYYLCLRRSNPAPYAAWMNFGEACCSYP